MKDVKGYEGIYSCDKDGNIYSLPKKTRKGTRVVKPFLSKNNGYLQVDLCKNGETKRFSVHRIIALSFLENKNNKEQVNHINGNKLDNCVVNLEWNTRSENQMHAVNTGLRSAKGIKNSSSKLTESMVRDIKNRKERTTDLAKEFNVSLSTISGIRNNKTWTHLF